MSRVDFTTQQVTETRQRLIKALAAGPGLLLVQGPSGCGKSHLKRQLSAPLARRFTLIDLPYSRLDPEQFTTTLATRLSPGAPPAADPVAGIKSQLTACARKGRPLLLLIDDVQFMPDDTRALLAALASSSESPPVYGILFADPGPSGRFSLLPGADPEQGLRQRVQLSPPAQADMEQFLEISLGEATEKQIPASAREAIVQEARGSLRRLRQLAELALLEAAEKPAEGHAQSPASKPRDARREEGSQFAFGLVSGEDIQGIGPDSQQAVERGGELNALTANIETAPDEVDHRSTATLKSPEPERSNQSRPRRWLPLALIATGGVALVAVVLSSTFLEKSAWLQRPGAEEPSAVATAPVSGSDLPQAVTPPSPATQPSATNLREPAKPPSPVLPSPAPVGIKQEPSPRNGTMESAGTPPSTEDARVSSPPIDIDHWLAQAREYEAAYQLTMPSEANAVLSYRRALELAPENAKARDGLERIQALYRRRANQALQQQEWQKAEHNIERLLWIDGDDQEALSKLARLAAGSKQTQTASNHQPGEQQTQQ